MSKILDYKRRKKLFKSLPDTEASPLECPNATAIVNTPHRIMYDVHQGSDPFESLPPEMSANIVKMAMKSGAAWNKYQHDFLVDSLARVSKRFKDLAALKSLWKGEVFIRGNEEKIKEVIQTYLNDHVTGLELEGELGWSCQFRTTFSTDDLLSLSVKCSELVRLTISNLTLRGPWSRLSTPLMSLKRLEFRDVFDEFDPPVLVDLHLDFPNIEEFIWVCTGFPGGYGCRDMREHWRRHDNGPLGAWGFKSLAVDLKKCQNLQTVKLCSVNVELPIRSWLPQGNIGYVIDDNLTFVWKRHEHVRLNEREMELVDNHNIRNFRHLYGF